MHIHTPLHTQYIIGVHLCVFFFNFAGIKCRSTKTTKIDCQLDDSLFTLGDNTSELEDGGESAVSNHQLTQERSKAGSSSDPKRRTGREIETSKSNTKTDYQTRLSVKGAASSRARKGNTCGSDFIDDDRTEDVKREEKVPKLTKAKSKIGAVKRRIGREKVETSNLIFNESSSEDDPETDSDSRSTESKGKKQKTMPRQKGKKMILIPKASGSARCMPSKTSNQQKQQSRMITRGNEDPGIDCDHQIVSTDREIKSNLKGRKNKDCKSGIKLTKSRGLSSHKSQKGTSSADHLSQDEKDEISAQKEEVAALGRSTRLKANFHDIAHFASDRQELEIAQQQDDNKLTKTLSKVGLKNAAPSRRGKEREASQAGIKNRVKSVTVKSRANEKHDPGIPAQHVPPQKRQLAPRMCKKREHD